MAKKRGKSGVNSVSRKTAKKSKSAKKVSNPKTVKIAAEAPKPMKDALHELEILAEEKKEGNALSGIEKKEDSISQKELSILAEEKKIEKETKKVEKLEKEIKKEVTVKPLREVSLKDLSKGIVGAFIGVVAHFAFIYGKQIASSITIARATVLLAFSYVLIMILMYGTGYREIKEKKLFGILPKRATAIFLTSLFMIPVIFYLFNQLNFADMAELYKQIAVTSVLASVGAGTADLIGKD